MSRPFSYNDENFTVIGNILFFHIKTNRQINANGNIIEIPPEIYYRVLTKTISGYIGRTTEDRTDSYGWSVYISKENDKYYLKTIF